MLVWKEYLNPTPPDTDSFSTFYKYTMNLVFENSRNLEKIMGIGGVLYAILKILNPRCFNKGTGKIIGSSIKLVSTSVFNDLINILVDCLENEDEDRFMFAGTAVDREIKKMLYDEGLEIRKKYNELETDIERNQLFSDTYKHYLLIIIAIKAEIYYDFW